MLLCQNYKKKINHLGSLCIRRTIETVLLDILNEFLGAIITHAITVAQIAPYTVGRDELHKMKHWMVIYNIS
jgi:hypothetical protein